MEKQLIERWDGDLSRKMPEALVIEIYREGQISRGRVAELLGLSFSETEGLLRQRGAPLLPTVEDLDDGRNAMDRALKR